VLDILCRHAAGDRLYIPERAGPVVVGPTDTAADVQRRYGVPRRTAYSWVQRYRR
jgi:transposase